MIITGNPDLAGADSGLYQQLGAAGGLVKPHVWHLAQEFRVPKPQ